MKIIRYPFLSIVVPFAVLTGKSLAQGTFPPPSGPAVPLMKSLAQVDPGIPVSTAPFTISAPGNYYLTGNLSFTLTAVNFTSTATGATLDLRGFQISTTASPAASAIEANASDLTIFNGTIRGAYSRGISTGGQARCTVRDINVIGPRGNGIVIGPGGRLTNCTVQASGNGITNFGIAAEEGAVLENCLVRGEASLFGAGFTLAASVTARHCKALNTNGDGFKTTGAAILDNCVSNGNEMDGFDLASGSIATQCTARQNQSHGFLCEDSAQLNGCYAGLNKFSGYYLGGNSSLGTSTAYDNKQHGVVVAGGARITGCMLAHNDSYGITSDPVSLMSPVLVEGNSILNNGLAGIAGFGISPIIIRNQVSANFSGSFGPGLTPAPTQAPATATNPFANFGP